MTFFTNFKNDESGAVTIDWVVLTAAVVGFGLFVAGAISGGVDATANSINTQVTSVSSGTP